MGARAEGERRERIESSPRWRDGAFRNLHPIRPGLRDPAAAPPSLADLLGRQGRRVPTAGLPSTDPRPTWLQPVQSGLRATWLGHSTVLLELDGWRFTVVGADARQVELFAVARALEAAPAEDGAR